MTLVIDASLALKWFIDEENSSVAQTLLTSDKRLIAPTLVIAELCNAAWRLWRRGEVAREQVTIVAGCASDSFGLLFSEIELAMRASQISLDLRHPAYDCFYLALAERENAPLVTADRRLVERVTGTPWAGRVVALDAWSGTG